MDPCHLRVQKAVLENKPERIKRLVEGGHNVNETDNRGFTPLHIAVEEGNAEIVCLLVCLGANIHAFAQNRFTALHVCAECGCPEIASELIRNGADMEATCKGKKRPLHICAVKDTTETARCLLESGANKDAPCKKRWTALHLCAHHGTTATAEILLQSGANKDAVNKEKSTPLHLCAERGTADVARALLHDGANIEALNESSSTPLHVCVEAKKTDVLIVLLDHGANVDAADKTHSTALHIAAKHDYVEITRRLLERGARLDLTNEDEDTALFLAVESGCCGVVIEMLQHGPAGIIHARDPWGKTPLHVAATLGREPIARELINAGARRDLRDEENKTPCDYVKDEQHSLKELLSTCHARDAGEAGNLDGHVARMPSPHNPAPAEHKGHDFDGDEQESSASSDVESQSEEGSCFSSGSEEWTPDNPFGSRHGMLRKLQMLGPGYVLADNYIICAGAGAVAGKPHIKLAQRQSGRRETVVVKFYCDEDVYSNVQSVHSAVYDSDHICRMVERLKTERTGFPPSLVFEKGSKTLREWLAEEERSLVDKKWCLRQVLHGLKDAHNDGFVHGDIKPSNIVWFGDEAKWKLIDWDGVRKEDTGTVVAITPAYAAPEISASYVDAEIPPLARRSLDIWSVGMIAYELLTGRHFFKGDASLENIVALIRDGEVDRKLEQIEDSTEREALSKFLAIAPDGRWSVADALEHDLFKSDDQTTMEIELEARPGAGAEPHSSCTFAGHHTSIGLFFSEFLNLSRLRWERR